MIFNSEPENWKDLQNKVSQVFREIGYNSEVEKEIETVRGKVVIDVFVKDATNKPDMIYLCECKYWNNSVPQNVVHAFQTVVTNTGANLGYIISKSGFQKGAYEAAKNSNVLLLSWNQFQELLFDKWKISMVEKLSKMNEPFVVFMDHFSGPPRDKDDNAEFTQLLIKYQEFSKVTSYSYMYLNKDKVISFPREIVDPRGNKNDLNKIIVTNYRDYFDILFEANSAGIQAFTSFRQFLRNKHGRD